MKKYDKNNHKKRSALKTFMTVIGIIFILAVTALVYILVNNNISYGNIDDSAKLASENEAKNSTPIILNNVVLGGVYNGKFVSVDKYFLYSTNKKDSDIDMYNLEGKIGEYKISNIRNENKQSVVYAFASKENLITEYIAVGKGASKLITTNLHEVNVSENDIEVAKKTLGLYRILNTSISVNKVYETSIESGNTVRIMTVTNEPKKSLGAYSAIILYDTITSKATCLKYNYVRDVNNSEEFGIISLKFVCDLNNDGVNEIVIQETKEFKVKYSIITLKNNKFYQVLETEIEV